jgi:hypothetical protein
MTIKPLKNHSTINDILSVILLQKLKTSIKRIFLLFYIKSKSKNNLTSQYLLFLTRCVKL